MTTAPVAASSASQAGSHPGDEPRVVACAFCRRRLGGEYFFACRKCGASYCYIHMSRHQPALCARQEGRRRRQEASVQGGHRLLAGSMPTALSSANV